MDQKQSFHLEAKQILNDKNPEPFTDLEVSQIIELLEVFADVICHNMTQNI
jgi:hypothetical protein